MQCISIALNDWETNKRKETNTAAKWFAW